MGRGFGVGNRVPGLRPGAGWVFRCRVLRVAGAEGVDVALRFGEGVLGGGLDGELGFVSFEGGLDIGGGGHGHGGLGVEGDAGGEEAAGDAELVNLDELAHLLAQGGAGGIEGGGVEGLGAKARGMSWDRLSQLRFLMRGDQFVDLLGHIIVEQGIDRDDEIRRCALRSHSVGKL
jgi:hypothetical protein